jgi:hypothetical protein
MMSSKTLREAFAQNLAAWEAFPSDLIPDLGLDQLAVAFKQISMMNELIEASKSSMTTKTPVSTLKGTK